MSLDSSKDGQHGGKIRLFTVYTDLGAHQRIKWVVNAISKLAGPRYLCASEMWKLDAMTNQSMKRMLANDGSHAEVLVVVIGSLEQRNPEIIEWLDSLNALNHGQFGLLIGVLGDDENNAKELDWTAKELIRCGKKMNRKFIWHWMGYHNLDDSDWLVDSVEMLKDHQSSLTRPNHKSLLREATVPTM